MRLPRFTLRICARRAAQASAFPAITATLLAGTLTLGGLPRSAHAGDHQTDTTMSTTIKGRACGALWMQQSQYPFSTATLVQSNLEEVDGSTAQVVQSVGLCGGSWSQPATVETPVPHLSITYTKDFTLDGSRVTFSFVAAVYDQATSVDNAGEVLLVPDGAVKYSIAISGWPFLNFGNTLRLSQTALLVSSAIKPLRLSTSQISLPNEAQIDGNTLPIDYKVQSIANGHGVHTTFSFPTFGDLSYDPVLSLGAA